MKIRFYQYSEVDFTIEVKKWWGWEPLYLYEGISYSVVKHFRSKEDAIECLKRKMKQNPYHVRIFEVSTIIVHKQ